MKRFLLVLCIILVTPLFLFGCGSGDSAKGLSRPKGSIEQGTTNSELTEEKTSETKTDDELSAIFAEVVL